MLIKQESKVDKEKVKSYAQYSGMAYQLFGLLAISVFGGLKLDAYLGNEKKYCTAVICLLVLFAYFYKITVSTMKKKDK